MRLIDADALLKALKANCGTLCNDKNTDWCEYCCPHNDFEDLIDNAPTVEPDVNCSHCDYFKFTQTFIENIVKLMTDYNFESVDDLMNEINRVKNELGGKR